MPDGYDFLKVIRVRRSLTKNIDLSKFSLNYSSLGPFSFSRGLDHFHKVEFVFLGLDSPCILFFFFFCLKTTLTKLNYIKVVRDE